MKKPLSVEQDNNFQQALAEHRALRAKQRACQHDWKTDDSGLVDECQKCGELRG